MGRTIAGDEGAEIATELGIDIDAVEQRRHVAGAHLRREMLRGMTTTRRR